MMPWCASSGDGIALDVRRGGALARIVDGLQSCDGRRREDREEDDACVRRRGGVVHEIGVVDPQLVVDELVPEVRRDPLELRELRVDQVSLQGGDEEEVDASERSRDDHRKGEREARADAPERVHR
jgi:hypothetical protein